MPLYVSLLKFTPERIRTMKDEGIARSNEAKKNIEELGGKLIDAYYCQGEYDIVAIVEFPNNETATKAAARNASLGNITATIMPAVRREDWVKMLRQVWKKKIDSILCEPSLLRKRPAHFLT